VHLSEFFKVNTRWRCSKYL